MPIAFMTEPWPWYVAGPIIGLIVPLLLLVGNKHFGISSNLRHLCALVPGRNEFFRYDWKKEGGWNLVFAAGILLGGFLAGSIWPDPEPVDLSEATRAELASLSVEVEPELVPTSLFGWEPLLTPRGVLLMIVGGFLIGFGSRYAGGCTSGHAIMGLARFQLPSLVAVLGFFAGGLLMTHALLPWILGGSHG